MCRGRAGAKYRMTRFGMLGLKIVSRPPQKVGSLGQVVVYCGCRAGVPLARSKWLLFDRKVRRGHICRNLHESITRIRDA